MLTSVTFDLYLFCLFYGKHLTDDQAYVLDQFVQLVKDIKPDAVILLVRIRAGGGQ